MNSSTDDYVVIQTILGESADQPLRGQIATSEVIRRRASIGGWFGSTHKEVVLKDKQFSFWNDQKKAQTWLRKHVTGKAWQTASRAWHDSEFTNYTKGATHYCAAPKEILIRDYLACIIHTVAVSLTTNMVGSDLKASATWKRNVI